MEEPRAVGLATTKPTLPSGGTWSWLTAWRAADAADVRSPAGQLAAGGEDGGRPLVLDRGSRLGLEEQRASGWRPRGHRAALGSKWSGCWWVTATASRSVSSSKPGASRCRGRSAGGCRRGLEQDAGMAEMSDPHAATLARAPVGTRQGSHPHPSEDLPGHDARRHGGPGKHQAGRGQRARRLRRSTSIRTTERASSRSQPREAKSASALLTVSREAPTSWASSSWVRSWWTWTPSSATRPNRDDRSSRALATRPGHVGEDQVGGDVVGLAEPAGELEQQPARDLGAAVEPAAELVVAQALHRAVGDGGDRRGARAGVEQGQLAEHLTRAEDRQQVLAAVGRRAPELDLAVGDDVEPVALVALVEQHVAAADLRSRPSTRSAPRRPRHRVR